MAVSPGVLLAINDNGNIPGPQVVDSLAVLLLGGVELSEAIALPVRGDIEGGDVVLTTDHEDTGNQAVVVSTIDRLSAEEVLA